MRIIVKDAFKCDELYHAFTEYLDYEFLKEEHYTSRRIIVKDAFKCDEIDLDKHMEALSNNPLFTDDYIIEEAKYKLEVSLENYAEMPTELEYKKEANQLKRFIKKYKLKGER